MLNNRFPPLQPSAELIMLLIPALVFAGLVIGCMALRRTHSNVVMHELPLWLVALNLLETPVNTLLLGALLFAQPAPYSPAVTLALAVLLIPAMGLSFLAPQWDRVAWRLLGLDALRWLVTVTICISNGNSLLSLFGTLVLLGCMVRAGVLFNRLGADSAVRRRIQQRVERVCGTH